MEPNNNLENQFRDKLNAREIQPSPMAWDRLDAMLTVAENKKPKRKFPFLMIAASFLVFSTLGFLAYHFMLTEITVTNIVVGSDKIKIKIKNEIKNQIINPTEKVEEIKLKNQVNNLASISNTKSKSVQKVSIINQNSSEKYQPIVEEEEEVVNFEKNSKSTDNKNINVNAEALLASVDSNTEIKQQNITVPKIKVNPSSLLIEVDSELTFEYRDNVFQKINRTYQKVKVALSNRNQK